MYTIQHLFWSTSKRHKYRTSAKICFLSYPILHKDSDILNSRVYRVPLYPKTIYPPAPNVTCKYCQVIVCVCVCVCVCVHLCTMPAAN